MACRTSTMLRAGAEILNGEHSPDLDTWYVHEPLGARKIGVSVGTPAPIALYPVSGRKTSF